MIVARGVRPGKNVALGAYLAAVAPRAIEFLPLREAVVNHAFLLTSYYSPDFHADLELAVSPERLSPYLAFVGGNAQAANDLYCWNIAISSAFMGSLCVFGLAIEKEERAMFCVFRAYFPTIRMRA
jgi:hypothetical protein